MRPHRKARIRSACAIVALLAALPAAVHAQATLAGRVVDADTGHPVIDAVVTLEPASRGIVLVAGDGGLLPARTVVTGAGGGYRFTDLVPGRYRLRVERLGYRGRTVEVEVIRPADAAVSVGLEVEPVVLEPMQVRQRAASWFQRASNARSEPDHVRIAAERERQHLFPSTDTRVLTWADMVDGVTLGEGDVFRALQRFAGVATRDDYTAELWTRGAPWTQTRVTFDGVPLFNPVHAVGILSAITPEVLGSVFLHPGVRPASSAEGAAGVVDLRSRAGSGGGALRGVGDISMASTKLVLEQSVADQAFSWIVAGRRSHLDVLAGGARLLGLDTLDLPYVFHDVAARVDIAPGGDVRIEASGLLEEDRLTGDVAGVLERTLARWGNAAGRVTVHVPVRSVVLSHTLGASRFHVRTEERIVRTRSTVPSWVEPASRNGIGYVHVTGAVAPMAGTHWSMGWDVARLKVDYDGSFPRHYAARPDTARWLRYERELTMAGVWGDLRVPIGGRVTLNPGLRLETGGTVPDAGWVRAAPRITARVTVSPEQTLSISAGRAWQHVQAIAVAGPSVHPAFHAAHFWVWPDARTPAIRADVINIGTERWLGRHWLGSANGWARRSTGLALPDPAPGPLGRRPLFVTGRNDAHGVEMTLRRMGASWSTSLGYTYGMSEIAIGAERFPAPADRRHVFDGTFAIRLRDGLRAAAAYTAMSGAPFTRAYSIAPGDCSAFGFGCDSPVGTSQIQQHNAERTPDYRALDVSLHWTRPVGRMELSVYGQVRNVLGRDNASTYAGSAPVGRTVDDAGTAIVWHDRFESGLRRVPLAGLRLAF